ncbi:MAG: hypothetical protein NW226_11855 [Microscillaceae bacterium]|nr:hypothetical protein [Microscillaceae bacterium]
MKIVTLNIYQESDWELLELLLQRLHIEFVEETNQPKNISQKPSGFILDLLNKPLKINHFKPLGRDEIYE